MPNIELRRLGTIILLIILICGAFFRFYNLDWGSGNFFHPDERNIGYAVTNLDFSRDDYNPNFFAYGSLPIYLFYLFTGPNLGNALLFGRLLSALLSTIVIFLVFLLTKKLGRSLLLRGEIDHLKEDEQKAVNLFALGAATLTAFSPGLIQFAHFTTFETILTFLYLLLTWYAIKTLNEHSWRDYLLMGIILGAAISTKITSLTYLALPALVHLFVVLKQRSLVTNKLTYMTGFIKRLFHPKLIAAFLTALLLAVATSPFFLIDAENFLGSLDYESGVATGNPVVFYTQQYLETIPVIYQITKVLPVTLNLPLTILTLLGLIYLTIYSVKFTWKFIRFNTNSRKLPLIIFTASAYIYAIFNFYLFVKWTRYMIPFLPYLIIAFTLLALKLYFFHSRRFERIVSGIYLFVLLGLIFSGVNFFYTYTQPDPRLEAAAWLSNEINPGDRLLTEVYDIGVVPFNSVFGPDNVREFNFYDLDDGIADATELVDLQESIAIADYIIVPSKRIFPTRARLPERYPNGYEYYNNLFNGTDFGDQFERKAEFYRPTLLQAIFGNEETKLAPLSYDETWKVFDQPTVIIYARK